jgi:hypothetical protein
MISHILGFLSVIFLDFSYQIIFSIKCKTLLKFFEMIKTISRFSCENIWMHPILVCDLRGFYI